MLFPGTIIHNDLLTVIFKISKILRLLEAVNNNLYWCKLSLPS